MHIITDENGNPIPHGHDGHCHEHENAEHCHTHEDGHCHAHGEEHCHAHGEGPAKTSALLKYMLDHNTHHAAELDQMAKKLQGEGQEKAAEQILKAVDEFQKGNMYLSLALSLVKEP